MYINPLPSKPSTIFQIEEPLDLSFFIESRIAFFADSNIISHAKARLPKNAELFLLPPGEKAKTRQTLQHFQDLLLEKKFGKDCLIIALGGGASCDLVGFLAATYLRGVSLIFFPSTLLAMVDASIGGKNGINTHHGKNLIGTIYHPKAIWMDLSLLDTLPPVEMLSGLAEVLKYGLIADRSLWEQIEKNGFDPTDKSTLLDIIKRSAAIKIRTIEKDPEEKSLRAILNFGHTVGHAIEQASNYTWRHGEAVAIGCIAESYLSHRLGYLPFSDVKRIEKLIRSLGFPFRPLPPSLKEAMSRDKKAKGGRIRFVLLKEIGRTIDEFTSYVDESDIDSMLEWTDQLSRD